MEKEILLFGVTKLIKKKKLNPTPPTEMELSALQVLVIILLHSQDIIILLDQRKLVAHLVLKYHQISHLVVEFVGKLVDLVLFSAMLTA